MIYLFSGDDSKRKHKEYEKFLESLPKEVETFFISKNDFNKVQIESFYSGAGLFFNKCIVIFSNIFEREEIGDFILEKLELMGSSQNDFLFLEGKLNKQILDAFKKARAELNIFELPKEKKERYDNFQLAWAFADRDKLGLWVHFRRAMDLGVSPDELIGILFWKAKDMLLKKNFSKFSETELKNFSYRISYLLPQTRKEGIDSEISFEQFLLEAF
ncbi:hypothetical protein KKB58_02220 [Patescibacteria group bacterium]|nr:hypothetical protein [Patescibacteria group bacterium]